MYAGACAHMRAHVWRIEVNTCLPQSLPPLFIEAESLSELGAYPFWLFWLASLSLPPECSILVSQLACVAFFH